MVFRERLTADFFEYDMFIVLIRGFWFVFASKSEGWKTTLNACFMLMHYTPGGCSSEL